MLFSACEVEASSLVSSGYEAILTEIEVLPQAPKTRQSRDEVETNREREPKQEEEESRYLAQRTQRSEEITSSKEA